MGIEIIIKITAIGLLTAILGQILKQMGKDEIATITTLAGFIVVIIMALNLISQLFSTFESIFNL